MNYLEKLKAEVDEQADSLGVGIILLLVEKWEEDIRIATEQNTLTANMLLNYYVGLKISLHHVKKHMDRYWGDCWDTRYVDMAQKARTLDLKTKEARRNYYVAKRRNEKHWNDCSCRGCRCISSFGR